MKKIVSILLALTLVVAVFAGCTKSEQQSTPPSPSTNAQGTVDGEAEPPVSSDGWPAIGSAEAPIPVKVMIKDVLPDEEDVVAMVNSIREKMAAHGQYLDLQIVEPPAGSYATALPLAMRTGDIDADIIYFQGGGDLPIAQEGLLEDLTPYLERSIHVKNIMLPVNETRMKNYPYLLWLAPARVAAPVMRKDFAQQLDSYKAMSEDPTVENYLAMFREMKEKGLVEYAVTVDNSGASGEGNMSRMNSIFNQAFGVTATLVKEGDRWAFSKATEAEKNKLEFYATLYSEGLLDPEYLTNTWDVMEQKFYESKVGVIAGTAGSVIQIYNNKLSSTNGVDLVALPPAKGIAQGLQAINVTKEDRGFGINSENKEAAWALLEFMASPEGRIIDLVGIEGKHHIIENNQIVLTDRHPEWWSRFWETSNQFNPKLPLAQPLYVPAAQASLDFANQYYVEDVNILIPEELAPQWDAMKTMYDEYSADIIRGVKPISSFDEFVQKWNNAGGDAFAEYLATKLG